jgi:hypothetical protein
MINLSSLLGLPRFFHERKENVRGFIVVDQSRWFEDIADNTTNSKMTFRLVQSVMDCTTVCPPLQWPITSGNNQSLSAMTAQGVVPIPSEQVNGKQTGIFSAIESLSES